MILKKIKDILNLKSFDKFADLDFSELSFDDYKILVNYYIGYLWLGNLSLVQVNLLAELIKTINNHNIFDSIEDYNLATLLKILSRG